MVAKTFLLKKLYRNPVTIAIGIIVVIFTLVFTFFKMDIADIRQIQEEIFAVE